MHGDQVHMQMCANSNLQAPDTNIAHKSKKKKRTTF
jgi:hypothetical protein